MQKVLELERAVIEVFGGCNYKCQMCPQTAGRGKDWKKKMPLSLFEDILEQLPGTPIINLEGSGEPTMLKDLPDYISLCNKHGFNSFMYTNGARLTGSFMNEVVDAGISFIRFSCIGYDPLMYQKWMAIDNFELLKNNIKETRDYINAVGSDCILSSYHLILDNSNIEKEIDLYKRNFIDELGIISYIWCMHNWSGNYAPGYTRGSKKKSTCGRPFAPEITVRAGGLDGKQAAVTPCCQTMGPPNEAKSVLGHLSDQTLEEVYYGDLYEELRDLHSKEDFDKIDYCKHCDFLYEDPEVLVWSNDPEADVDYMLGTNFSLKEYKK